MAKTEEEPIIITINAGQEIKIDKKQLDYLVREAVKELIKEGLFYEHKTSIYDLAYKALKDVATEIVRMAIDSQRNK